MFELTPNVKTLLNDFASKGYCVMPPPSAQEQEWLYAFVQEKWLTALLAGDVSAVPMNVTLMSLVDHLACQR